jgi:hypothetical protein
MATDERNNYWEQHPEDELTPNEQSPFGVDQNPVQTPQSPIAQPLEYTEIQDTPENPPITWTAQEYVHIDKGIGWFALFILVIAVFIAIDFFLLKSWTFFALVIVMSIAIIVYIRRPPRTLTYALSPAQGLYVGERLYIFDEFRAFGLIKDGENHSIMLIPRKRFAPGVSVYFPEEAGERIVDILGQRLPIEELKLDIVDILIRKLRL